MESILTSMKKLLGMPEEYEAYDADLIIHINSVFGILHQLGAGPDEGFSINNKESVWSDFLPKSQKLEDVKSYMYLKVRLIFDPPQSSSVLTSMQETIKELEWRINAAVDPKEVVANG